MKIFKLYYFMLVAECLIKLVFSYSVEDEINLHRDKFTTLHPFVRPKNITSEPILVSVTFYLQNIYYLDEKEQVLKFSSWFNITWTNDLLAWNESDYGGLPSTLISVNKIWTPDLYMLDAVDNQKSLYDDLNIATVASSGLVKWWPDKTFRTKCLVDTKHYPFDIQTCEITMTKWLTNDKLVMIKSKSDNVKLNYYSKNGEWDIVHISQDLQTGIFQGENITYILWTIKLRRKVDFYILNIILPITVLSFLNIFCFVLPADSGEKISYSMSVFLTFSVFMLMVSESLPKTSDEVCLLSIFILLQLSYSALIIIMNVLILKCVHKGGDKEMDSKCLTWLMNICACRKKNHEKAVIDTKPENKIYPDKREKFDEKRCLTTWKEFAEFLDKFFFLAFLCINVFTYSLYIILINV